MSRQFKVTVNGREYEVSVLEVTGVEGIASPPAAAPPVASRAVSPAPTFTPAPTAAPGAGDVVAGMGGVVVEIHVGVGQSVAPGDRLLVLEAMKMKSPVIASHGGRVTRVMVAPKDAVEGGQVLVTIE
ncbi:MAG: acetyl-CoA carboxylase biotin carboxyl carrier protein subunit [Sulfuritalea sp.]|jgi:biotin carboxyl carrier protein|nr:acetyl-CoA carboxylase biotin carboxyl carrier protein subunit [Sulfuritalea sp.]